MTVILAAVNARFTHSSLALRYLRNEIEAVWKGAPDKQVLLREYIINQNRVEILRDLVLAEPDAILLSVYIWNAGLIAALLPDFRALLPDCALILGGPEVSYNAEQWLERFPCVDRIVSGAGEEAVRALAESDFRVRDGGERLIRVPGSDFSRVPFPYREEDYHILEHRYLYYESTRGCPFSCTYCLSSRGDHALQSKSAETTCAELDRLLAHHPMLVKFVDRSFNAEPERARDIWRHLLRNPDALGTRFHFEIHPSLLGEEDFEVLTEAPDGLFQFEIGVQSVNPKTLQAVRRPSDWNRDKDTIRRIAGLKRIHLHLDLIAGLPFEGMDEFAVSFDEVFSLRPDQLQLGFLKGLPGTEIRERAELHGLVFMRDAPYEILRTRWLSAADLAELASIAELVENTANTRRYDGPIDEALSRFGSAFRAYRSLSEHCAKTGYDIRTRNEVKVKERLEAWLNGEEAGRKPGIGL